MHHCAAQHPDRPLHPFFLKDQVAEQKRKANALLPISRLPPELVVILIQLATTIETPPTMYKTPWTWTVMTRVYHYWRTVAFANPALWSHIVLRPYKDAQLRTWIKRAKDKPLVIRDSKYHWDDPEPRPAEAIQLIFAREYWDRVQELDLRLSLGDLGHLKWPARRSTSLASLALRGRGQLGDRPHLGHPSYLMNFIRSLQVRRLLLSNFDQLYSIWSVREAFPSTLTHLHLDNGFNGQPTPESCLQHVIRVLQHLPLLQSLDLTYMLQFRRPSTGAVDIIRPRNLREISVRNCPLELMQFLRHLDLSSKTFVRKRIHCSPRFAIDWDDITSTLSSFFQQSPASVRSCIIMYECPEIPTSQTGVEVRFEISCFTEQLPSDKLTQDNSGPGDLEYSFLTYSGIREMVWSSKSILDTCSALPIQTTEALVVYGEPSDRDMRPAWCQYLCREFCKVQVLRLWASCAERPEDLPTAYLLTCTGTSRDIIFPELRDLHLSGFIFKSSTHNPRSFPRRLGRALKKRREMGKGVESLYVSPSYGLQQRHLDYLHRYVDKAICPLGL